MHRFSFKAVLSTVIMTGISLSAMQRIEQPITPVATAINQGPVIKSKHSDQTYEILERITHVCEFFKITFGSSFKEGKSKTLEIDADPGFIANVATLLNLLVKTAAKPTDEIKNILRATIAQLPDIHEQAYQLWHIVKPWEIKELSEALAYYILENLDLSDATIQKNLVDDAPENVLTLMKEISTPTNAVAALGYLAMLYKHYTSDAREIKLFDEVLEKITTLIADNIQELLLESPALIECMQKPEFIFVAPLLHKKILLTPLCKKIFSHVGNVSAPFRPATKMPFFKSFSPECILLQSGSSACIWNSITNSLKEILNPCFITTAAQMGRYIIIIGERDSDWLSNQQLHIFDCVANKVIRSSQIDKNSVLYKIRSLFDFNDQYLLMQRFGKELQPFGQELQKTSEELLFFDPIRGKIDIAVPAEYEYKYSSRICWNSCINRTHVVGIQGLSFDRVGTRLIIQDLNDNTAKGRKWVPLRYTHETPECRILNDRYIITVHLFLGGCNIYRHDMVTGQSVKLNELKIPNIRVCDHFDDQHIGLRTLNALLIMNVWQEAIVAQEDIIPPILHIEKVNNWTIYQAIANGDSIVLKTSIIPYLAPTPILLEVMRYLALQEKATVKRGAEVDVQSSDASEPPVKKAARDPSEKK